MMNSTFKKMLETAYICDLDTVGEGISNWLLHSTQCYPHDQVVKKEQELMAAAANYADDTLITDILTLEECQALDDELNKTLGE